MVLTFPTKNIYQFFRRLVWCIGGDRMRFGSELRRKAEQIFVSPTCAGAVFVCCEVGRGHGNLWGWQAGRTWYHSTMERKESGNLLWVHKRQI